MTLTQRHAITWKDAQEFALRLGARVRHTIGSEYRLTVRERGELSDYFTESPDDAIETARVMLGSHPDIESAEEYLAQVLSHTLTYADIKAGDRVTILTPHSQERIGRAVMQGPAGWVLNMGGAHGTPAIADERNTLRVRRAKGGR